MLIAEQLMLLLLDPEHGELDVRHDATDPDRLAAAAIVLDFAEQRSLIHRDGHVTYQPRFRSGHPLLAAAGEALTAAGPALPIASALELIETRARPVAATLLDGLHRRDLLHRMRRWPWSAWKYPLRSSRARNEALSVLGDGAQSRPLRALGLLLLIDSAGRLAGLLDANAHARATDTLLALGHRRGREDPGDAATSLLAALRATLLDD